MSAREIMEELPRLTPEDLHAIERRVAEITRGETTTGSVRDVLLEFAGSCDGLPDDFASEHDHYLYGTAKK